MSADFFPENGSAEFDLNVANGNAHIPVSMMSAEYSDYGIPVRNLQEALAKVMMVSPTDYTREQHESGGETSARIVFCGVTVQQATRYRDALVKLLKFCIENKTALCWG